MRRMYLALLLLGIVCVSLPAWSRPTSSSQPAAVTTSEQEPAAQPVAVVPVMNHDAGRLKQGQPLEYAFVVKNEGHADLKILSAKPG